MIYYFGNYLADGKTFGDSNVISASTSEQANYFINMINSFIYNADLTFFLTFTKLATDQRMNNEIIVDLKKYWENIPNITLEYAKIRILTSKFESREKTKMTDYGTLEIYDARLIVKILYKKLMEKITTLLLKINSKTAIWKFLLGFLDGDGSALISRTGRFYIKFAANIDNLDLLTKLLNIIEVHFNLDNSRIKAGGKGVSIIISIQQILKHLNECAPESLNITPRDEECLLYVFL